MVRHFAVLLVLAAAFYAHAQERRYEYTNQHFAITLPADWKEVDPKKVPYATDVTRDRDFPPRAYQLVSETNFPALIFVEIDDQSRIPEREVAMMHFDGVRQSYLTYRLEAQGLRLLDSTLRTNRLEVRISATADYPKIGKTRQLTGWFITEKGSYTVTCVAPVEHFKTVSAVFTDVLDKFYLDPALKYRPQATESKLVPSDVKVKKVKFGVGWIFALGALALFIVRRFTRVNSDEV